MTIDELEEDSTLLEIFSFDEDTMEEEINYKKNLLKESKSGHKFYQVDFEEEEETHYKSDIDISCHIIYI